MSDCNVHTLPYRLWVGVTGHRALAHPKVIGDSVRQILTKKWKELFDIESYSRITASLETPIAFTAISALAEGADRIVAEAVLEMCGGMLEAPLPFDRVEYRNDFITEVSQHEFDYFLSKASQVSELPFSYETSRDAGYLAAGERMVIDCDFLIAIWDGKPSRGVGGTADIVNYAVSCNKPCFIINSDNGTISRVTRDKLRVEDIEGLNRYNSKLWSDGTLPDKDLHAIVTDSAVPSANRKAIETFLYPHYANAEGAARTYQKSYNKTGKLAYFISTLSVAFMAIAVVFSAYQVVAMICYVLELMALLYLFIVIHHAQKNDVHIQWLQNRALAERIRSALFYVACGVLPEECDNDEFGRTPSWVGRAIAEIRQNIQIQEKNNCDYKSYVSFIKKSWIKDQMQYHQNKSLEADAKNSRLKFLSLGLFGAAIAVSAVHLITTVSGMAGHHPIHIVRIIEEALTVIAVILPAAAASVGGYRVLLEYPRIASRSSLMVTRLNRIYEADYPICNATQMKEYIHTIELSMLDESKDWLNLMTHADLERIA